MGNRKILGSTLNYMENFTKRPSYKEEDACGIAGLLNFDKNPVSGERIRNMIELMRERENGLGGGFAAYGLFPKYGDKYCIQLILEDVPNLEPTVERVGEFLKARAKIIKDEKVRVDNNVIRDHPLIWRFFIEPKDSNDPDEIVKNIAGDINCGIKGAFCMSCGKDMAVFKGSAFASDIAKFYEIDKIKAYMWTAHSRFPTNTPGWWGGAHPFSLLGHAVVHNGEITSYGTNVNYLREMGYSCRLLTDSEVLVYLVDLIIRKSRYPERIVHQIATMALAPPYWREIDNMPDEVKKLATSVRITYRKAMANGPFSIIVTTDCPEPSMIGHSDRKKLRPLIAAISGDEKTFYLSSELSAIHRVDETQNFWQPDPGKPVIASTEGIILKGNENQEEDIWI